MAAEAEADRTAAVEEADPTAAVAVGVADFTAVVAEAAFMAAAEVAPFVEEAAAEGHITPEAGRAEGLADMPRAACRDIEAARAEWAEAGREQLLQPERDSALRQWAAVQGARE